MRRKLYGISEIAEAVGASRGKVSVWRGRGHLPDATAELTMGPVWTAEEIEPWIRKAKRLGRPESARA